VIITISRLRTIIYELLSYAIEHSNNIISLFKELENIRIDA
jgi:anti-sigma regulatory factor (Ser/Thr protein kinase)